MSILRNAHVAVSNLGVEGHVLSLCWRFDTYVGRRGAQGAQGYALT